MGYSKYGWATNQISEEDMARLYNLKKITKKPITTMISEAVKLYLSRHTSTENTSSTSIEMQ